MPAAGLSPSAIAEAVRVGPEDVDEAGDLVAKVGIRHQAKELIQHVANVNPPALVAAGVRPEDKGRSEHLDADEVYEHALELVGPEVLDEVIKARVRGPKSRPEQAKVIVLFAMPSGRTARCMFPYTEATTSQKAYDKALAAGEVELDEKKVDETENKALKRKAERLEAEVARLSAAASGAGDGTEAGSGQEPGAGSSEATGGTPAEPAAVELPEGNVKQVRAKIGEYSPEVLKAILKEDKRKTVVEAAKAELKRRKDG